MKQNIPIGYSQSVPKILRTANTDRLDLTLVAFVRSNTGVVFRYQFFKEKADDQWLLGARYYL